MKTITKKAKQAISRRRKHLDKCTDEVKESELAASSQNSANCIHCATAWASNQAVVLEVLAKLKKLKRIHDILNENT